MEVVLRTATYWDKALNPGDTANVPDEIGERWIAAGLAARPGSPEADQAAKDRPDYDSKKKAELVDLARDRGIEGYSEMTKAELVTALEAPAINEPAPADQQTGTVADVPPEARTTGTAGAAGGGGTPAPGTPGTGTGGGGTAPAGGTR